jgi:hypothetical protein
MGAILEKNNPSGKPTVLPDGMASSEVLKCDAGLCQVSYTLAYGATEHRIQEGRNVVDVMREKATALISNIHPLHAVETYVWGGIHKGWLDREQATAAGM